jgi:iron complex outermembrane receptor protein
MTASCSNGEWVRWTGGRSATLSLSFAAGGLVLRKADVAVFEVRSWHSLAQRSVLRRRPLLGEEFMRRKTVSNLLGLLTSVAVVPAAVWSAPVSAQTRSISVAQMPLADALKSIQQQSGTRIDYDPDAVKGKTSQAVHGAANAREAVNEAVSGTGLALLVSNGQLTVVSRQTIVVTAHRDEAETNVLVRQSSTSDRLGQSLREQARNTQVISSKELEQQQAQSVVEALQNAGGVTVSNVDLQGGSSFSIRGFPSNGVTNGLSSPSGVTGGETEPVANIERVEVLKGPDAILSGVDNLGGTINVVTKKPSADPLAQLTLEGGSWDHIRGTIDINEPITTDQHLSARFIASAADEEHNYGGYVGHKDYLIAPSLRFKNSTTDIILSFNDGKDTSGLTPYLILNPSTLQPYPTDPHRPIFGKDQKIEVKTDTLYGEVTQKITDWLTFVGRAQHQTEDLKIRNYGVFTVLAPNVPLLLVYNSHNQQKGRTNAFDAYLRFDNDFGLFRNKLSVGYTWVDDKTTYLDNSNGTFSPVPLFGGTPPAIGPIDEENFTLEGKQTGIYAQDLVKVWRLNLTAGVRHSTFASTVVFPPPYPFTSTDRSRATTANFGAVVDATSWLSLFASDANGFSPNYSTMFGGRPLPNITTRNLEGGLKADLLRNHLFVTASYFRLKESSVPIPDPAHRGFYLPGPGQLGKGIDLSASGALARGLTVQGSFTRTKYSYLSPQLGPKVFYRPRDKYSLFVTYIRPVALRTTAGFGLGIFGNSSIPVNLQYSVPAAVQVNVNGYLNYGPFSANLGIRNFFNRRNYGSTSSTAYLPIAEPRNLLLTLSYRFQ